MLKKICSLLLVLIISLGVTACNGSGGGAVTLKWVLFAGYSSQRDTQMVMEVFNEKLQEIIPNVSVQLVEVDAKTWSQKMAAGEKYDIAWTGYNYDMAAEITNGSYLELDEYINEKDTPNIYKEQQTFKDAYDSATVDGKLYAIPNEQPIIAETPILKVPADLLQYLDVEAFTKACWASPITTREVYDVIDKFLEAVYAADAQDTDKISSTIDPQNMYDFIAKRGYDFVDTSTNLCYEAFNENAVLVDFTDTDSYKLWLEYAAKWYEKGYISNNILLNGGTGGNRLPVLTAHSKGMWFGTADNGVTEVYDTYGDLEQYYVNMNPKDLSQTFRGIASVGSEATYTAIPFTSKHPEEAMQVIELLRSEKGTAGNELLNLLVYGFEKNSAEAEEYGVYHYTLNGDEIQSDEYIIQPSATTSYGIPHWVIGNVYLTYRTSNILEGQSDYAMNYITKLNDAYQTKYCGFRPDFSNIKIERSNMATVIAEYEDRLICGVQGSNYNPLYEEYKAKLKTAEKTKVMEDLQSQMNEFAK